MREGNGEQARVEVFQSLHFETGRAEVLEFSVLGVSQTFAIRT